MKQMMLKPDERQQRATDLSLIVVREIIHLRDVGQLDDVARYWTSHVTWNK